MKRLQRYILMHTAKSFLPAFVTLSLLMVVGFCMQLLHEGLDVVRLSSLLPKVFAWCVPIATQCLHAAGAAMAFKLRGERRCAVSVIGDGGTSEGAFYEALNLAGARTLPAVFVVVNNKWAISVPLEIQTASETLAQKAVAAGIRGVQVDGNDVLAVRQTMEEALELARNGQGPSLVEAVTYRLSDHTTADDASRYRRSEEVEDARRFEPLIRLRAYLDSIGAWDDDRQAELEAECATEVEAAVEEYLETAPQPVESMFDYMYAELPEAMDEQRVRLASDTTCCGVSLTWVTCSGRN